MKPALCLAVAVAFAARKVSRAQDKAQDVAHDQGDLVLMAESKEPQRVVLEHKTHSPDKKLFAGYYRDAWDETISLHDAATGKQLQRIIHHGDHVTQFKFSDDGKTLASWAKDKNSWKLWEVATGKLVLQLPQVKEVPKEGPAVPRRS